MVYSLGFLEFPSFVWTASMNLQYLDSPILVKLAGKGGHRVSHG